MRHVATVILFVGICTAADPFTTGTTGCETGSATDPSQLPSRQCILPAAGKYVYLANGDVVIDGHAEAMVDEVSYMLGAASISFQLTTAPAIVAKTDWINSRYFFVMMKQSATGYVSAIDPIAVLCCDDASRTIKIRMIARAGGNFGPDFAHWSVKVTGVFATRPDENSGWTFQAIPVYLVGAVPP